MASIDQKFPSDVLTAEFPQLRLPHRETADNGIVRLGNGVITSDFPQLRLPKPEIADSGIVRLGNGVITADFPLKAARKHRAPRS